MMSVQEIQKVIACEKRRVKQKEQEIESAKADLRATRKSIKFWEQELKQAKKAKV